MLTLHYPPLYRSHTNVLHTSMPWYSIVFIEFIIHFTPRKTPKLLPLITMDKQITYVIFTIYVTMATILHSNKRMVIDFFIIKYLYTVTNEENPWLSLATEF